MFDEFGHHHRVLFRHVGRQGQKVFEFFAVRHDVHRGAGEHVARPDQHREAHFVDETVDVVHRGQFPPSRLVDADPVEHRRKFVAVFGVVDVFGRSAEDRDVLILQPQGQVVRDLSAGRDDHAFGRFEVGDVEHPFERQLVEVEAVAGIVVGRNGFGIVVDHYRTQPLPADRVQRIDATPVEFHRAADPVGPRSEHDHRTLVVREFDVVRRAVVRDVQVVGHRRVFGRQRVDLLDVRRDAAHFPVFADRQHIGLDVFCGTFAHHAR